jgi:hypothetical protein
VKPIPFYPFVAVLFLAMPAKAQLQLDSKLAHVTYIQFEPVIVETSLRSQISQPVVINGEGNSPRFHFEVRNEHGHQLPPVSDPALTNTLMISGQTLVRMTNDMARLFSISRPGPYSVQPCIEWMGKTYRGEKKHFEVVTGREIARVSAMVPADQSTRTYIILHVNRAQQDQLILRLDNEAENLCHGVFPLGRTVMNEKPQIAVDIEGNIHVLFQSAPRMYTRVAFSPFGARLKAEAFGLEYTDVSLQSTRTGAIEVDGRPAERTGPRIIDSIIENR